MTTPQPQATGNPQTEDARVVEDWFENEELLRSFDDELVGSITAGRAAWQRYRDHTAAVEAERDRLLAFVKDMSTLNIPIANYATDRNVVLAYMELMRKTRLDAFVLLVELAGSATAGEDGER